jgi:filamentous hemagglutinin
MRNQAHIAVHPQQHQSRFTALMCLLLCTTLNIQWLAAIGGQTISLVAGNNLTAQGATIISDAGTALRAGNDITLTTAQNTVDETHSQSTSRNGLMSTGGAGFSLGRQSQSSTSTLDTVTNTGTTVAALSGNVTAVAGNHYTQTGSNLIAPLGSIAVLASDIVINEAHNTATSTQTSQSRQSGLTVSLNSPVIAAAQTAQAMQQAASQTDNRRMQALAGATSALAGYNAYQAVSSAPAGTLGGASMSAALGTSRSQSQSTTITDTVQGSTLSAGGNVTLIATGANQTPATGNITIQGSNVSAGGNVILDAQQTINLLAAANHSTTTASNSSSSASLGATVGLNGTGGVGVSATANVARGTGSHSATSTTYTNTHIRAGNQTGNTLTLQSGGDTNLIGATASGNQIIANIGTGPNGGNLTIQSLQDQSTYRESNQSTSIGGSVPIIGAGTASVNANASRTNINSTYQSVTEQSSLAAGNGGFQINVQGATSLTGATITSTQSAVDNNANTLTTQSISASALHNTAAYNANATSVGISYSGANANGTQSGYNGFNATPPSTLSATGNANSTTQSGISGLASTNPAIPTTGTLDSAVRTDTNTANTLAPIFNPTQIKASFAIVTAASQQTNTYIQAQLTQADALKKQAKAEQAKGTPEAQARANELNAQANDIEALWGNGSPARSVTSAFLAAMSGNTTGTASQWIQATAVNYLQGQAASWIKDVSDHSLGLSEASPLRAAMHAIAACAGQAAQNNSAGCGAAAIGAATASIINGLANDADGGASTLTNEQKEARKNLLTNLIAGLATAAGSTQTAAMTSAATIETENNGQREKSFIAAAKTVIRICGAKCGAESAVVVLIANEVSKLKLSNPTLRDDQLESLAIANVLSTQTVSLVGAAIDWVRDRYNALTTADDKQPLIATTPIPPVQRPVILTTPISTPGIDDLILSTPITPPQSPINTGGNQLPPPITIDDITSGGGFNSAGNTGSSPVLLNEANDIGKERERKAADQVGGTVSNEKIKTPSGSTDIDVIGPNGELIAVGGPNKAANLDKLSTEIWKLQYEASKRGVEVKYALTPDTPKAVIDFIAKKIGAANIIILR